MSQQNSEDETAPLMATDAEVDQTVEGEGEPAPEAADETAELIARRESEQRLQYLQAMLQMFRNIFDNAASRQRQ